VVLRSHICLLAADGVSNNAIAKRLGTSRPTVILWRTRFAKGGPAGIAEDAPHGMSSRRIDGETVKQIVDRTLHSRPPDATHWSTRTLAKEIGVSHVTVARVWEAHGLQPHRIKTFKLSKDPRFVEKLTDVVGLYLNPPEKALVLCVDEKSQIQALDRTQPGLPIKKGRCGTMTHDYKRNGTTTLFVALEIAQGIVVGQCYARHRHQEFLKFLKRLDGEFPGQVKLHLVMDNYGTHKHPRVQGWLKHHPRFVSHFIPTSSSWLNLVERWFGELTGKRVRRGVFVSVEDLIAASEEYVAVWNQNPKPFVWTATVESIVEKLRRCRQTLEQIKPGCTLPRAKKNQE
ncbi:MAG: IS630 family transposase, partial [Gemmatimonadales bacterium]